jgi:hypothetical protein
MTYDIDDSAIELQLEHLRSMEDLGLIASDHFRTCCTSAKVNSGAWLPGSSWANEAPVVMEKTAIAVRALKYITADVR